MSGKQDKRYQYRHYNYGSGYCCRETVVPKFNPTKYRYFHHKQEETQKQYTLGMVLFSFKKYLPKIVENAHANSINPLIRSCGLSVMSSHISSLAIESIFGKMYVDIINAKIWTATRTVVHTANITNSHSGTLVGVLI